ncbi:Histone H1-delta, partial [Lamellibrachia satsuma]
SAAVATPAKPAKKAAAKPKKPAAHPKYTEMIAAALGSLKERGGSSRQAILKYIMKSYNVGKDERVVNQHLKMALRAGAKNGALKQSKGTGASGSFRLGEKKPATSKPKTLGDTKKAKTPKKTMKKATKSPKKLAVKKPAPKKLK